MRLIIFAFLLCAAALAKPRARDLGIPFDGTPGPSNAITDVPGVEVGYTTLISGEGKLVRGKGPVRTGVTAILPHGRTTDRKLPAAWFSLNGNGEMTGTTWIDESGFLEGPIMLTNTDSVGVVRDAVVEWGTRHFPGSDDFSLPVVAETWDGLLNDIEGFHVTRADVFHAIEIAHSGHIDEGNVGGGTGMVVYRFKGGTGSSSRRVNAYTVGTLVQANFGQRSDLRIAGVPVGQELTSLMPEEHASPPRDGSIIAVVATDAPLLPHQLKRIIKRVALGLGRAGSLARDSSGDLFIAFSTAAPRLGKDGLESWKAIPNDRLDDYFGATVEATEESVANALVAAETMTGINGNKVYAIPHEELIKILKAHKRWHSAISRR